MLAKTNPPISQSRVGIGTMDAVIANPGRSFSRLCEEVLISFRVAHDHNTLHTLDLVLSITPTFVIYDFVFDIFPTTKPDVSGDNLSQYLSSPFPFSLPSRSPPPTISSLPAALVPTLPAPKLTFSSFLLTALSTLPYNCLLVCFLVYFLLPSKTRTRSAPDHNQQMLLQAYPW